MKCPGCQRDVDERIYSNCPFCSVAVNAVLQASPGRPATPGWPSTATTHRQSAVTATRLAQTSGTILQSPTMERAERNVYRGILIGIALVVPLTAVGIWLLAGRYSRQQAAFQKQAHIDLSTPRAAALEIVNTVKGLAWARFYYVCEFADHKVKDPVSAEDFARGMRRSAQQNPNNARDFRQLMDSVADISIGHPNVHGGRAEVPITVTALIAGARRPLNGLAHLVNEDGNWRLDITSVRLEDGDRVDPVEITRPLLELFGISVATPQGGSRTGMQPAGPPAANFMPPARTYGPAPGRSMQIPNFGAPGLSSSDQPSTGNTPPAPDNGSAQPANPPGSSGGDPAQPGRPDENQGNPPSPGGSPDAGADR